MLNLFEGQTVEVIHVDVTYEDGDRVETETRETVENVLCMPLTDDADRGGRSVTRPDGSKSVMRLSFPKPYDKSLLGARVVIDGTEYNIDGDPKPIRHNCPTAWWMTAEASIKDGIH